MNHPVLFSLQTKVREYVHWTLDSLEYSGTHSTNPLDIAKKPGGQPKMDRQETNKELCLQTDRRLNRSFNAKLSGQAD